LVTAFLRGAAAAAAAGVSNIIFSLKEARRPQFAGRLFSTLILLLIVGIGIVMCEAEKEEDYLT